MGFDGDKKNIDYHHLYPLVLGSNDKFSNVKIEIKKKFSKINLWLEVVIILNYFILILAVLDFHTMVSKCEYDDKQDSFFSYVDF